MTIHFRSITPRFRALVCATLFATTFAACGGEPEDDESDDCDVDAAMARCDRCLDSCGPGCDASTACEVSCSGC